MVLHIVTGLTIGAQRDPVRPSSVKLDSIDLYVTRHCNQSCSFCFHSRDYFENGSEMTPELALSIVDWARRSGVKDVAILGGEPTLYRHLGLLVARVVEEGMTARIVSNGQRPFQRFISSEHGQMLSGVHVSVDGMVDAHDQLRGAGSFTTALKSIQTTIDQGIPVTVNMTVSTMNISDVPRVYELFADVGVRRLNLHWMSPVGRAGEMPGPAAVDRLSWNELLEWVASLQRCSDEMFVECQDVFGLREKPACAISDLSNLQFFPDASVFSCGMLVSELPSGHVFENGELYSREGHSERVLLSSSCSGCPAVNLTGEDVGGCIYSRVFSSVAASPF